MTNSKAQDKKFLAEAAMFEAQARELTLKGDSYAIGIAREQRLDRRSAVVNDELNIYHFFGEVTDRSVFTLMRTIETFARLSPEKGIEVLFTSPGGSILAGLAAIDHIAAIRRQYGVDVTTVALGMAASMAGILLQSGDRRVMGKESWLLIHEASFMAGGSYGEVMDTMDWIGKIQDRIVDLFVARSGGKMTKKKFVAGWKRKDWWLSAEQALEAGFIDEVR